MDQLVENFLSVKLHADNVLALLANYQSKLTVLATYTH